jgi:PAS domain S-box-containing protein
MKKRISVLVVDDDEDDFILLKSFFGDINNFTFDLFWTPSYDEALRLMVKNNHDVVIIDYLLGGQTGLELLKTAIDGGSKKPVIVLTGQGSYKVDLESMELGAADFLVKSELNGEKLERSIRYALDRYEIFNALKESEEKYRTIFESSRDMIYITNEEGIFLDVNESASRIFGFSKEEFMKIPASNLYEDATERSAFIEMLKKTGIVSNHEVTLKDKSGNKKFCLISATIQPSLEGTLHIFGIIHDITRRKKMERDLMIAEKLSVTGRLARMLAHEIRYPLTSINLTLEQLEFELGDKDFEAYTAIIKRNCRRIGDLITELLHTSKLPEVHMRKCGVSKLIDETLELSTDRIELKKIKVEKQFSEELVEITVDEAKIKTALLNVIVNAIEAVPDHGGLIRIKARKEDDKCYIEVEDNGVGIPQKHIGKLFEPYFTQKQGGIGLGLSTTHNIIQSHGGTIEVESVVNKGTKFAISLNL